MRRRGSPTGAGTDNIERDNIERRLQHASTHSAACLLPQLALLLERYRYVLSPLTLAALHALRKAPHTLVAAVGPVSPPPMATLPLPAFPPFSQPQFRGRIRL